MTSGYRLLVWFFGWAVIVVLSLVPGAHLGWFLQFPHAETALHFAGYASIVASATLFCRSTAELIGVAMLSVVVASALEFLQLIVPGRGPSLSDAVANAGGAASGCVAACIAGRLGRLTADRSGSRAEEG